MLRNAVLNVLNVYLCCPWCIIITLYMVCL